MLSLRVGAEDLHRQVGVQVEGPADGADLVGEAHLEGVEAVVDVLGHLGHLHRHPEERPGQPLVEPEERLAAGLVDLPDHRLGRVEEVADAGALAQELRVDADPEVGARALARRALQDGHEQVLAGAGQHRAAEGDGVALALGAQGGADLLGDPLQVDRRQAPVGRGRGAHADQRQVAAGDALGRAGGDAQRAGADDLGRELADALLDHRRLAAPDHVDLLRAHVDPDDLVAPLGQAGRGDAAHVAQAEHADSHPAPVPRAASTSRRRYRSLTRATPEWATASSRAAAETAA